MLAISAVDAISPAIQRTKFFLFRGVRMGTYLKLCLVAIITESVGGSFHFGTTGGHAPNQWLIPHPAAALTPGSVAGLAAALVVFIVVFFVVYYLITRLRFAYFHCLIHNTKEIRPGWRLYRAQARRFFWLSVYVGVCILLALALAVLPFVAAFWKLSRSTPAGGHADVGVILALALPLIPIILLAVLAVIAAGLILRDMMLPHFALENARAGEAWRAVWTRIKAEKGSFFVYALLRIVLPIAALIGLLIVLVIPGFLFVAAVTMVEGGIQASFSGAVSGIFLEVLIGMGALAIALFAGISVGGPLGTAIREYALLFYGSRYRPLGDLLAPPPLSA
ncbi:MAG TPA: hypothetical protein VFW25_02835 [Silvibacterium sp.]|nr:hypothetical protein [Silvibacterium sp.]